MTRVAENELRAHSGVGLAALRPAGGANAPVKLVVHAAKGPELDANVSGFYNGYLMVELETTERAKLYDDKLLGATPLDCANRRTELQLGSPIKVRVLETYPGSGFVTGILVREVRQDGTF